MAHRLDRTERARRLGEVLVLAVVELVMALFAQKSARDSMDVLAKPCRHCRIRFEATAGARLYLPHLRFIGKPRKQGLGPPGDLPASGGYHGFLIVATAAAAAAVHGPGPTPPLLLLRRRRRQASGSRPSGSVRL